MELMMGKQSDRFPNICSEMISCVQMEIQAIN